MSTQPARGMRDFLPEDVRRRDFVIGVIRDVYDRYGFEPLETPAVENIDTLLGKYGDEGNKLIFKILKRGEHEASGQADLALRYDLTVPLARVVAEHQAKLPKFFKRYQIQPVWRADRPARGRFREFYQCDIDVVGTSSPLAEAELCAAASEVMTTLGFEKSFVIRLNHRAVLGGLLRWAGVPEAQHAEALVAIDKLDKLGLEAVFAELVSRGIDASRLRTWVQLFSAGPQRVLIEDRLAELRNVLRSDDAAMSGITNLEEIVRLCQPSAARDHFFVDPNLARGLSYYTGAIFEITVPDLAGSLGGGGRYDNLIGMFLGRDVPACGFSLGLERILVVMDERDMFPPEISRASADVMVTIWSEATREDALDLAGRLRGAGLRVDLYPEADKLGKQLKYASGRLIPLVTVVGDDERVAGTVTVRDLRSAEQQQVPRDQVAEYIKQRLEPFRRAGRGEPGTPGARP